MPSQILSENLPVILMEEILLETSIGVLSIITQTILNRLLHNLPHAFFHGLTWEISSRVPRKFFPRVSENFSKTHHTFLQKILLKLEKNYRNFYIHSFSNSLNNSSNDSTTCLYINAWTITQFENHSKILSEILPKCSQEIFQKII